ncbi:hypothetical protein [Campylobacter gracilis]|uniref:Uncharacterized protein n=1 Tax=Campylobacter gracilis RM3268 TaxID=553220 RepID=C8PDQ3_9BACT|nr:hypothetical protein [Campylobacter gracilis]AKT91671.1 hypothetical protein CGRAC_0202 [Campylobacter gracilis]EEV19053.1 hypothetical protein CAMGR0001_2767 [Campylobacter gracilis RM3268]UEB46121.1 hypothetical protein LK410_03210 [Campylobacter gracilis]SUW77879.1 Uncharacterised protein [Campylobacter gracilis]
MSYFLIFILAFILGILACPIVIFLRARKCGGWDHSNMMNIFRVIAHLATHPDDFAKFRYEDGSRPFWYLGSDEFADVVKSRPKE